MKEDTKWRLRDIEGKEYIIIDSEKVDMQEELNKMIKKQMKERERLNNIINELEENMKDDVNMIEEGISHNTEYIYLGSVYQFLNNQLDKIKELKGDGSND